MSTDQAAAQLGITRQRVVQLLRSGSLVGERISGTVWLVESESVARRALTNSGHGRRWDEDLVWEIILALSDPALALSREAGRRTSATPGERLSRALGSVITVVRYDAPREVRPFLALTGVSAVETIDDDLMADTRVLHGYAKRGNRAVIREADLLEDPSGHVALHRFRSGEDRVRTGDWAPRALIAVDCGSDLSSRVRSSGLKALERMRAQWLARHTD